MLNTSRSADILLDMDSADALVDLRNLLESVERLRADPWNIPFVALKRSHVTE